jgi:hypothetical protein
MPNAPLSQNTSFIPKQGPARRTKQTATRQIHLLTIFAYIFFATSLLTSLGLFLFNNHLDTQLNTEVRNLNEAIAGFSDADMERVREFNTRLWQAKDRLDHTVALSSIFDSIEAATSKDVMFEGLSIVREGDQSITLEAKMITESFDSALFQRGVLERDDVIESVTVEDIKIITEGDEEGEVLINSGVSFTANLVVPVSAALVNTTSTEDDTAMDTENTEASVASSTVETLVSPATSSSTVATTTEQTINQETP